MSAPDRIMVSVDFEQIGRVKVKTSCVTVGVEGIPDPFDPARYLLSIPAREHADELVEALGDMLMCYEGVPMNAIELGQRVKRYRALLAKIKEASNE